MMKDFLSYICVWVLSVFRLGSRLLGQAACVGAWLTVSLCFVACSKTVEPYNWPARLGASVIQDSIRFILHAPGKDSVCIVGDMNDWVPQPMTHIGSEFIITVRKPESEYLRYQYEIDGGVRIADPLSLFVLDPDRDWMLPVDSWVRSNLPPYPTGDTEGPVSVKDLWKRNYRWHCPRFVAPDLANLTIYRLDVRDFLQKNNSDGTFIALSKNMAYFKSLGVNAIELASVMESLDDGSAGRAPSYPFAIDKFFGSPVDFKVLVDSIHSCGMAVFLDVAFDRISCHSPWIKMYSKPNGNINKDALWFDLEASARDSSCAPSSVVLNFLHPDIVAMADSLLDFWVNKYHIDGYALLNAQTLSSRFRSLGNNYVSMYVDQERIGNIRHLAQSLWIRHPSAIMLCSNGTEEAEEATLAKDGIVMFTNANDGFGQFVNARSVDNKDVAKLDYSLRGWIMPRALGAIETPGAPRLASLLKQSSFSPSQRTDRLIAAAAITFCIPGPKSIWQYQELGYDLEPGADGSLHFSDSLLTDPERRRLLEAYKTILNCRSSMSIFKTKDFETHLTDMVKYVVLRNGDETIVTVANFDSQMHEYHLEHNESGEWIDILSRRRYLTISSGKKIVLQPGECLMLVSGSR